MNTLVAIVNTPAFWLVLGLSLLAGAGAYALHYRRRHTYEIKNVRFQRALWNAQKAALKQQAARPANTDRKWGGAA